MSSTRFWKAIDASVASILSANEPQAARRALVEHHKICARDAAEHLFLTAHELTDEDFFEASVLAERKLLDDLILAFAETGHLNDMPLIAESIDAISKAFQQRLNEISATTTRRSAFMETVRERMAEVVLGQDTRRPFLDCVKVLAESHIEAAYRLAIAPGAPLPTLYRAFNAAAANLIDALHRTASDGDIGDPELVKEAEQAIITTCQKRAAELVVDGVLVKDRVADLGGAT